MIEIKNNTRGPVAIMVKSFDRNRPKSFTTKTIPGIGSGKHICLLEDERYTPQIETIRKTGLISVRIVTENIKKAGEKGEQ